MHLTPVSNYYFAQSNLPNNLSRNDDIIEILKQIAPIRKGDDIEAA